MVKRDHIPQDLQERAVQSNGHGPVSQVSPSLNRDVTPVTALRLGEGEPPGPREHFVERLMPKGHMTSLFGDGGAAKSILALSAGTAISGGEDMAWPQGREQPGPLCGQIGRAHV